PCPPDRDRRDKPGDDSENAMSPDLYFALTLIVKMAITAGFLLAATVTAERFGPLVGGLVATLPISAGPVYILLAQKRSLSVTLAGAYAIWIALMGAAGAVTWTLVSAVALNIVVVVFSFWL